MERIIKTFAKREISVVDKPEEIVVRHSRILLLSELIVSFSIGVLVVVVGIIYEMKDFRYVVLIVLIFESYMLYIFFQKFKKLKREWIKINKKGIENRLLKITWIDVKKVELISVMEKKISNRERRVLRIFDGERAVDIRLVELNYTEQEITDKVLSYWSKY